MNGTGPQYQLPSMSSTSCSILDGVHSCGQYGSPSARMPSKSVPSERLKPLVELQSTTAVSAPGLSEICRTAMKPGIDPVCP